MKDDCHQVTSEDAVVVELGSSNYWHCPKTMLAVVAEVNRILAVEVFD